MKAQADKSQGNKSQSVSNATLQKQSGDESTFQFEDNRPEAIAQRKLQVMAYTHATSQPSPIQRQENKTGLPDSLKSGIESLSGLSMDDVKVHRNSSEPAQLEAHAYAQGSNIHLGPGQEKHLPHEAWHVVQQKQGRVKPTLQMKGGVAINDHVGLEAEADAMGAKALQLKKSDTQTVNSTVTSHVVQRSAETDMTDSRMNDLVQRVLSILNVLKAQEKNWQEIYGKKGEELGKKGAGKVKDKLTGKKAKKGPSLKEKIIKEALRRWWNSIPAEEKAQVAAEIAGKSVSALSKLASGVKGLFSRGPSEEEQQQQEEEQNAQFNGFLSGITLEDINDGYEAYKAYAKVSTKLKEFENKTVELASELGGSVGAKVGEIKTEKEFVKKFKEQQKPHTVARLEFEFLKESITDESRYKDELEALSDALDTRLQGPSGMIYNTQMFSNREQTEAAHEACSIAYDNLKMANIFRNTTTSGLSHVKNWFKKTKEKVIGKSSSEKEATETKQTELVSAITAVCNKKWSKFTGLFVSTPKGVVQVKKQLDEGTTPAEKLTAIQENLVQPEKELASVEEQLSAVDESMGSTAKKLKTDLTVDKALSETRTEKDAEKYGDKQVTSSSEMLKLGAKKVNLEHEKSELTKKIQSKKRHPLTQVFYNALKGLEVDDTISLGKTVVLMNQIGQELDTPEKTKKVK